MSKLPLSFRIKELQGRLKWVIRDTGKHVREAELLLVAGSLAYTTILSIIPVLAVSLSIFKAFGGMEHLYAGIEPFIIENLAEGADEEAMIAIRGFIERIHAGALGIGGVIALIITTMSMLSSIEKAVNRVWNVPVTRSLFQRVSYYWLFITLGPLALSVAIGFATSFAAQKDVPLTGFMPGGMGIFLLTTLGFYLLYRYVPNRKVRFSPAALAGLATAVVWNLARLGYSLYTQNVVSYQNVYGSLGAIPILLLWIYIVWVIVLTGASLSAALQKRMDLP